jgi:RND family efflux transporter MFP subunit
MTKKRIVTIVSVIAVAVLLIKGKGLLETRKAEMNDASIPQSENLLVPVVKAEKGTLQNKVSFLAQLDADKSIKLSTKLAGYVEKLYVNEAQSVKKGELLVSIDATELLSSIKALDATLLSQKYDLKVAHSIHERNIKLHKVGGLAKEKLDISKVTLDAKKAQLANTIQKISQLKHQLSYLKITAPFDGTIDAIFLHEGDLAAAGKPIISMSNEKQKLRFSYAPGKERIIEKGQPVFTDGIEIGQIRAIYSAAQNGLAMAEVFVNEPIDLPVGSSVSIEVVTETAQGCILPDTTLLHKKEGIFLMAYEKGRFSPVRVDVPLQEGDRVVVRPCPKTAVANASEVRLAQLPAHNEPLSSAGESNE